MLIPINKRNYAYVRENYFVKKIKGFKEPT